MTGRSMTLLAAVAASCLGTSAGCASRSRSAASTATSTPQTSPTGTSTSVAPPPPTTTTEASCSASDLRVSVTSPQGSAGALHYQLVFDNASSTTCTLYGFPGVSFLDSQGHEIGPPAQQGTAVTRQLVTLHPGAQGYARLDVTDPGIPPCAGPGNVAQIRVYPPGSYVASTVTPPPGTQVCTSPNTPDYVATTVGPVAATAGNS